MIIDKLKQEMARQDKPENRHNYQRFHKEKLKEPWGLKTQVLRKISNDCFKDVRHMPKDEILDIGDRLLASDMRYGRFLAFEWALKVKKDFTKQDFARFEIWLKKYVNNWGACDHFCGITGHLVAEHHELTAKTKNWTRSKNRWLRRAAAVSLIEPVRRKMLLDEVFRTADILLTDEDDMVQKGYGWMLKEASNVFQKEVFAYVMKNKACMPRTALRYAIEKMPPAMRKRAMAR
ncbi:MAG: DNA alkylation repair protein [candidate division Zixibacteria bacterium]|nr:DNA alkylation repair protein [candidate division Zixibacteria bacterium]